VQGSLVGGGVVWRISRFWGTVGGRGASQKGLAVASRLPPHLKCATAVSTACLFVALIGLCFAAPVSARTRCSYSGLPDNVLTVTADRGALTQITRRGQRIVAGEFLEGRATCAGGVATVLNTDTIRVELRTDDDFVDLFLAGGPFEPGATPEAEGASEIEVDIVGPEPFGTVHGTRRADEFRWGPGVGRHAGLNLNPRTAGDADVDVTVRGGPFAVLEIDAGAGDDTVVPAPGALFPNNGAFTFGGTGNDRISGFGNSGGILVGNEGDDVLTGGRGDDNLIGFGGNDRIRAAGGADVIDLGPGRDLVRSGPGRDRIKARDSQRDTVRCGPGRDRVEADQRDGLRGCEVVSRQ
jgi:Ca2+-binding RTX toxin-like protein